MVNIGDPMSFSEAGAQIVASLEAGMVKIAEEIMTVSLEEVPKEEGVLARSARIMPIERTERTRSITFGYGFGDEVNSDGRVAGDYAVPVHERLEAKHAPPTKAKFLEDPVIVAAATMEENLAVTIRTAGYHPHGVVPIGTSRVIHPVELGMDE